MHHNEKTADPSDFSTSWSLHLRCWTSPVTDSWSRDVQHSSSQAVHCRCYRDNNALYRKTVISRTGALTWCMCMWMLATTAWSSAQHLKVLIVHQHCSRLLPCNINKIFPSKKQVTETVKSHKDGKNVWYTLWLYGCVSAEDTQETK